MTLKPMTPGQRWLEKRQRNQAADAEAAKLAADKAIQSTNILQGDVAPGTVDIQREVGRMVDAGLPISKTPFTADEVAAIEPKIGRKLSQGEIQFRLIARPESTVKPFTPVPAVEANYLDAEIEAATREIEAEKVSRMSVPELRLYTATKTKQEQAAAQASEAARLQHLAAVKPQLEKLHALRLEAMTDPSFSADDIAEINAAISQLSFVGGDEAVTNHLIGRVAEIQTAKVDDAKAELSKRLTNAGLEAEEIEAAIAKRFPTEEAKPVEKPEVKPAAPSNAVDAAFATFHASMNTLRAANKRRDELLASEGAQGPNYIAARAEANAASRAASVASAAHDAAKAASEGGDAS